ncbi:MAG: DUF1836 domain-containing protein [Oscillospiraceae bacterium]
MANENISELSSQFWDKQERSCRLPRWNDLPDIGLYMDQVLSLMSKYIRIFSHGEANLTPSMINNYVKLGILPPPVKKKYSRVHISHLLIICAMKSVLPIQVIGAMIEHLLKSRTEEELLNFFSEQYEQTFHQLVDILHSSIESQTDDDSGFGKMLITTAIQAAAVSSGSKIISENALGEMQHLGILKLQKIQPNN